MADSTWTIDRSGPNKSWVRAGRWRGEASVALFQKLRAVAGGACARAITDGEQIVVYPHYTARMRRLEK